jgi:adenylate kinase family enzyme
LQCVERWGGNDGPDDAMENFQNWTLAYVLGGPESILTLYKKAWEGHLVQYTKAKAPGIEMAKDGMYYKEFITSFDWEHTGEALAAFHFYGLARPNDRHYLQRVRRFAAFYMNEDPEAPNYDPQHKIIKSLHNGSKGPKLTPASEEDWGGLPVPGDPERLTRYRTAGNIRGDHPLNLCSATLAFNAYALTHESKYRDWLLEYAGAWRARVETNGGNIPTNIGLDGRIGGEWDGKWYGGVFGWNFDPQTSGRNYYKRGPRIAFGEAFLLTADQRFVDALRHQIDNLYAARKVENGRTLLPNKFGDNGWYGYMPNLHSDLQTDIYLWSLKPSDCERIATDEWIAYLEGKNPEYPAKALEQEFQQIRRRVEGLRQDKTTPDTRSSDHSQRFNPVRTGVLVNLTLGGNDPGSAGNILHSQVRYFDPVSRRAGLPQDVAALVEKITPEGITITLVNTNPVEAREMIVQMGAYGEHQCNAVIVGGRQIEVDAPYFHMRLAPGSGEHMTINMKRYAHQPTMAFPWDRTANPQSGHGAIVILLGPPGAGKGTQAELIIKDFDIPAISTGDLLRAEVKEETPLGKRIQSTMAKGDLVSDDIVNQVVAKRIENPDAANGFILDGYPRTLAQAEFLDKLAAERGFPRTTVLLLAVPDEEVMQRLLSRGRSDDKPEVIRDRLAVYKKQTMPLLKYYSNHHQIEGIGTPKDVFERIKRVIAPKFQRE